MTRSIELYLAWLLSLIGTLISLYFSEIRHLEPCHMCWYQRICLFPLAIILGMATYKNFLEIIPYMLPQVVIGLLFAFYQVSLQEIPGWNPIDICGAGPSCVTKHDIGLGPITIPMLSSGNFLVIGILLLMSWKPRSTRKKFN